MITLSWIDRAQALRYMGVKSERTDDSTANLMDKAEKEIFRAANPSYVFCEINKDSHSLGGQDIQKVLKDSEKVLLFAVTLGVGIDRLLRKIQVSDMALAFVIDAMASAAVEQVADIAELNLKNMYNDFYFTRRYSPGYGDYPLERQPEVIKILNAEKRIGLSVTSSMMLNPTKSVTAVIGLNRQPVEGFAVNCENKCSMCKNKSCPYRKKGDK